MNKSNYNVSILVDGNPVKEHTKDNKTFIEAKLGSEYQIKIKNNKKDRILAVISVDGINVVTGKPATPDDTGYVINGYDKLDVFGYRKDDEGGGKFKFTDKETGYSKEIDGTGVNSGIIGVIIFAEKELPKPIIQIVKEYIPYPVKEYVPYYPPHRPYWFGDVWCGSSGSPNDSIYNSCDSSPTLKSNISYSADINNGSNVLRSMNMSHSSEVKTTIVDQSVNYCSTQSCDSPAPNFDAATTWGESYSQPITYTDFEKGTNEATFEFYYASKDSLIKSGVIKEHVTQLPQSFPSAFATPPVSWKK